ncbi:MAG: alpha/beta fold hydrolase [Akkermansiaceae bacterium]|nr:alpha/beta fold hydrolase [Akkermansiaceae bacterium]MCP5548122.1 alpha/beta fold hydrolase [Akkermansiaceae bacterium]
MKRMITPLAAGLIASAACHAAQPAVPLPTNRVVLVHGFLETGTSFKVMHKRLEARGADCLAPKLRPNDGRGGLDKLAARLKAEIDGHFGPKERISIVAFSMGGLVSRYYLQELGGADRCETFITISSPHHGTNAAWLYPSKGAVQMRPGSGFLEQLARSESKLDKIRVASFRTPLDLIILPTESSVWDRAENRSYLVALHPMMLTTRSVLDDVEQRLFPEPGAAP